MKAISIMQPWAYAILHLGKDIENRSWLTHYRGPLLVHAGKKVDMAAIDLLMDLGFVLPKRFDRGGIVGEIELVDCVPVESLPANTWASGPYCWVLRNPKPAKSFQPCRGQLGLFEVMKQKELI